MRYPGGKGKCYQRLINLMPPHTTYIESHLGGGAVLRHKRPAKTNIGVDADAKVIATWRENFPHLCHLVHADAATFLAGYRFTGEELVYADPPYMAHTRRNPQIYRHEYTDKDHEGLLDVLLNLPCKVMLSGYDNSLYNERLSGWSKVSYRAKTHVDVREECLWMNYSTPTALHDHSHLGSTFRDRQSVKRRHQRILGRFAQMDPLERTHVIQMLHAQYSAVKEAS